jgi:hypothetical protein
MQPTAQELVEKLSIRIRVCLQAYRNSMTNDLGFSRWGSMVQLSIAFFHNLASRGESW